MSPARRAWSTAGIAAAIRRRLHGPYAGLFRIEQGTERLERQIEELGRRVEEQVEELGSRVEGLESNLNRWSAPLGLLRGELSAALRAIAANEHRNRRLLQAAREDAEYERAWSDDRPLVSVTVATLGRPELTSRSLPSILGQSYGELEVIVALDGAGPEVGRAVEALGDSRVRCLDLGPNQAWSDDPVKLWLVGGTRARNAALREARGRWIVEFDDDDALRPECLEALIDLARRTKGEAVYGQVRQHEGGTPEGFCTFPPRLGRFSWAAGMYHAGLRFFGRELLAADLGLPGDWWLAERMLRAGVRFAMREEVLCDAYASGRMQTAFEEGGRIPWADDSTPWSG